MVKFLGMFLILSSTAFAFDWQGHRGARGLYPENTIGAMEEALKYPITTLEFDVVVTKDNKVILSHEPWMNELICTSPTKKPYKAKAYNLYKMTYEEIQKFDCGSLPYERFPEQKKVSVGKPLLETTLNYTEELLTKLNRSNVRYNIEIKSTLEDEKAGFQPDYKTFTDLVISSIRKKLSEEKFIIQSFDWRVLRHVHEKYPGIETSALIETAIESKELLNVLGFKPTYFSPYFKNLRPELVQEMHDQGIKVVPWTVNDVKSMEALIKMSVDGIITDYPNLISSVGVKKCDSKSHYFEGKCVPLPRHAIPSDSNPGWVCKSGYVQKRSSCSKIKLPPHAEFAEDGKTWICRPGYERYRGTCKKI